MNDIIIDFYAEVNSNDYYKNKNLSDLLNVPYFQGVDVRVESFLTRIHVNEVFRNLLETHAQDGKLTSEQLSSFIEAIEETALPEDTKEVVDIFKKEIETKHIIKLEGLTTYKYV